MGRAINAWYARWDNQLTVYADKIVDPNGINDPVLIFNLVTPNETIGVGRDALYEALEKAEADGNEVV